MGGAIDGGPLLWKLPISILRVIAPGPQTPPDGYKSNQRGRHWKCFNCQMEGGPGPAWDHREVQSRQSRREVADPNQAWSSLYPGSMFPNAITKRCLPSRHTAYRKFNHPLVNCDRPPAGLLEGVCPHNTISVIRVDMLN